MMGTVIVSPGDRIEVRIGGTSRAYRVYHDPGATTSGGIVVEHQPTCVACGDNDVDDEGDLCPLCARDACYVVAVRDALTEHDVRIERAVAALERYGDELTYPVNAQAWDMLRGDGGNDVRDALDTLLGRVRSYIMRRMDDVGA